MSCTSWKRRRGTWISAVPGGPILLLGKRSLTLLRLSTDDPVLVGSEPGEVEIVWDLGSALRCRSFPSPGVGSYGVIRLGHATRVCSGLPPSEGSPELRMIEPPHGSLVAPGAVDVRGSAVSAPEGAYVTVNGFPLPLGPGGEFQARLPVPSVPFFPVLSELVLGFEVLARDRVVVLPGPFLPRGHLVPGGISVRLTESGLDKLEAAATEALLLSAEDVLPPGTKVLDDRCVLRAPLVGCLEEVDATVDEITLEGAEIHFDAVEGALETELLLEGLALVVDVDGTTADCTVRIRVDATTVRAFFDLLPEPEDPTRIGVDQTGPVSVDFSGFHETANCSGVLGSVVELLLPDTEALLRGGLEDLLGDPDGPGPLDAPLAEALEVELSDLRVDGQVVAELFELRGVFSTIEEDAEGVVFVLDAGVGALRPSVELPGSHHVAEMAPDLRGDPAGASHDMGLCVSTSFLDRFLSAASEAGLFRARLRELPLVPPVPLRAGVLAFFLPAFARLDPELPVEIDVRATVAPFSTGAPGPRGEVRDLLVPHLLVEVLDPNSRLLRFAVDGTAGLEVFALGEDGTVRPAVSLPDPRNLTIVVLENRVGARVENLSRSLGLLFTLAGSGFELPPLSLLGVGELAFLPDEPRTKGGIPCIFGELEPATQGSSGRRKTAF
ncbi:MAG: hypothetical protein KatS3mg076_2079 [Candidatus Binatia bacterium]|nr:MAG: hypothetical protein KatS3mg076_2079 [Candidatus Binatia bacterium]